MYWGEPIVQSEDSHRGLGRPPGHQISMSLNGPSSITATVQIKDGALVLQLRTAKPFRADPSLIHRLIGYATRERMTAGDLVIARAQLCQAAKLHDSGTRFSP